MRKDNRKDNELIWEALTEATQEFDGPGMQMDGIDDDQSDAESSKDASSDSVTKMIRARAFLCTKSIDTIYDLVKDKDSEMLDKQALEAIEDIMKYAQTAFRELSKRAVTPEERRARARARYSGYPAWD